MILSRVHGPARFVFWAAVLVAYVCALLPGDPAILASDKGNHGIAFATLASLARVGWPTMRGWKIAVGLIAFGGLIELSQSLPQIHRDASWGDLIADALATGAGLLIGLGVLVLLRRLRGEQVAPGRSPRR